MIAIVRSATALIAVAILGVWLSGTIAHAGNNGSAATDHVVEITGFKFVPESVTVQAGDTITWINRDIAPHTATADDLSFDTGELKLNDSVSITVSSDQSITYFCQFHPVMKAKVMFE